MRRLDIKEIAQVHGGAGERSAADRALTICNNNNLPDSTRVTIKVENAGSIGAGGTHTSTTTSVEVETTCGALREAAKGQ